ncbi:MAG: FAD-dependent oxidoreductase [Anaerolineales bacterium]|nr:FAD-dependent oxidoreductase [Anaerolineales bacterium]MCW5855603.1 FAD-dependent oxidoreductase [Anaerolineales bacterium]
MNEKDYSPYSAAVIGAGPAGLYAARELANAGLQVALINRDIKAGGLAEYGIYPNKYKMKDGLRRQTRNILTEPNIHYFGNLKVRQDGPLSLEQLQAMGFDAVVVAVGAQGTKQLGLPGEDLPGVYHAKDLVYHYNRLPPFGRQQFPVGQRVVCVGVGNVMLDIAHWLVRELQVDEVVAVARRSPADVKFTKKEMEAVVHNLDQAALDAEIERTRSVMLAAGQDPEAARAFILSALAGAEEKISDTRFRFHFLASPHQILSDEQGRVRALQVEETSLELQADGRTKAVDLGSYQEIPCDTVIFCIGDRVNPELGLPLDKWGDFAKEPAPRFPVDEKSYEAAGLDGVFLTGWAREASTGLVGTARKDGTNAAHAVLASLQGKPARGGQPLATLAAAAASQTEPVVSKADLLRLEAAEAAIATGQGLPDFKFDNNEEMLGVIGKLLAEQP